MTPTRLFEFIEYQNEHAPLEKSFTTKYNGKWESLSTENFISQSRAISRALVGLGIKAGDKIVILGGDNYRIGMGGAAVSSADTGEFDSGIELNAVQRSNPEMLPNG